MARLPYADENTDPETAALAQRIRDERGGRLLNLYRMLLNSPPIAEGWLNLLTAVRQKSHLSARYREMAIIRVALLNGADYEYKAHIPFAVEAGLTLGQIESLASWTSATECDEVDRAVLAYVDSMTRDIQVPDAIFDNVAQCFNDRELTELTTTIAAYNMVSRFLQALRVNPE